MENQNVIVAYLGVTAVMASLSGDQSAAETLGTALEAAAGDDAGAQMTVASVELAAGRFDAAAGRLEKKVLAAKPTDPRANAMLGLVEKRRGNTARADVLWQTAIDNGADDSLKASIERERATVAA